MTKRKISSLTATSSNQAPNRRANVWQLKVTQSDWQARVRGYPYRVIEMLGSQSLAELAAAILDSFEFEHDHAYGFYDNLKSWTRSTQKYELFADDEESMLDPLFDQDALSVHDTKISSVFREPKQKMLFLFDYGDEHRFIVQFLGTVPDDGESVYPIVVKSVGDPLPQYPDWEDEEDEWKP
ncbi:MAG: plasmid pRiA4b ORF-3 family protein [Alicyclobacillus herbarius]|uniref:IS1096 element passenger TnpR family protein n=1 Tax=Alicyclobacillus herbarius TaxID=122960 RepID=UPI00235429FB|nr:hypothetical protein [Alicyclobacillus herbarius]MCL6633477.1 plasmid pRiA4b ORF-3 family protein [Alicyclobacillus herbarius]